MLIKIYIAYHLNYFLRCLYNQYDDLILIWFWVLPFERDVATIASLTFTKLKFRNFLRGKARPLGRVYHTIRRKRLSIQSRDSFVNIFITKQIILITKYICKSFDDLQYRSHFSSSTRVCRVHIIHIQSLTHKMLVAHKKCSFAA